VEGRLGEHLMGIFPDEVPLVHDEDTTVFVASEISAAAVVGPVGQEERRTLAKRSARQHRWIAQAGHQKREVLRWGYRRIADLRMSTTYPDASPLRCKNKGISRLGYQTHYVVDGGKARVILDMLVTPAQVTENLPMLKLLFRSRFRWRLRPCSVTGDAAYGTIERTWRP